MNFAFCQHIHRTIIPSRRVSAVVSRVFHRYMGSVTDVCILLLVKAYLRRHWMWAQDSAFPERDLIEACYSAVNGENAKGWFQSSGYL